MSHLLLPAARWDRSHQRHQSGSPRLCWVTSLPRTRGVWGFASSSYVSRGTPEGSVPGRVEQHPGLGEPPPAPRSRGPIAELSPFPFLTRLRVGAGVTYNPVSCVYALHSFAIYYL